VKDRIYLGIADTKDISAVNCAKVDLLDKDPTGNQNALTIKDGDIVCMRQAGYYGVIIPIVQTNDCQSNCSENPDYMRYLWYFNSDGAGTFNGCGSGSSTGPIVIPEPVAVPMLDVETVDMPVFGLGCNGCDVNGKCIPIGTRLLVGEKEAYCGITGLRGQELDGSSCQNNYECTSNSCLDGTCQSTEERLKALEKQVEEQAGLIQKILNWISRIWS